MLNRYPQRGVFFAFGLYSFSFGAIFPRIGDMQIQMGVSQSTLGLSIIGIALGVQLALLVAGRLTNHFGYRRVMLVTMPLIGFTEALASLATHPVYFFICLCFTGLAIGLVEVAINVEADRVEHHLGRRIMNRSHAFWSFGFFLAGLSGAFIAQWQISPTHHLIIFAIVTAVISLFAFTHYQPAPPRPTDEETTVIFAAPTRPIFLLVALSLSAMLLEGAGIDWSVIFMRDVFATQPFISGLALTLFAASQFGVRYIADHYVERHGPIAVSRSSLVILGLGVLAVSLSYTPIMALAGFAMIGAGTAVIFPLAISAAAQLDDRSSAMNVASFAQFSFIVFLLAPPILGTIAEYFGIRISYAIGLPLVLLSFMTLSSLKPSQSAKPIRKS